MREIPSFIAGDFTKIREVLHPKNDDLDLGYSLALAELGQGESSVPHILKESSEVYIILSGRGEAIIDGTYFPMETGDMIHIPAKAVQHFRNTGEEAVRFLCVVSPPWSKDQEVIVEIE
ncbi:MAG: cupin domain-containing protein [Bacteroidota bacterium]